MSFYETKKTNESTQLDTSVIRLQNSMLPRLHQASGNHIMNHRGQFINQRRSPILQKHTNNDNDSNITVMTINNNNGISTTIHQAQPQSYETLESPSITATSNSSDERLADSFNNLFPDDLNDDLASSEVHANNLSQKVELLQKKLDNMNEDQGTQEEIYRRTKQDNDLLLAKTHSLEDQIRDLELSLNTRVKEYEKRLRDLTAKNNDIQLECDQHISTISQLQDDLATMQKQLTKKETLLAREKSSREKLEKELSEKNTELVNQDSEIHRLRLITKELQENDATNENIIAILKEELDSSQMKLMNLRQQETRDFDQNGKIESQNYHDISNDSDVREDDYRIVRNGLSDNDVKILSSSPKNSLACEQDQDSMNSRSMRVRNLKDIDGLEISLCQLQEENQNLRRANEDLQGQLLNAQLEEGRFLVQEGNKSYSLADEMGDINVDRLMKALHEQQEDNARLRRYVDDILIKVLERNPEILDKTLPIKTEPTQDQE